MWSSHRAPRIIEPRRALDTTNRISAEATQYDILNTNTDVYGSKIKTLPINYLSVYIIII